MAYQVTSRFQQLVVVLQLQVPTSVVLQIYHLLRLNGTYRTVEDIDPFVGMLLESPQPGSELGRVATCLLLEQFNDTRHGDRFWYERDDPCTGFTMAQLTEIRKASLARVICDNSDGVFTIQPQALLRRTNNGPNDEVPCSDLPRVDLNVFKESKYFFYYFLFAFWTFY